MLVHTFLSDYLSSNVYLLEFEGYENVILIDCGVIDTNPIMKWLEKNKKKPSHVFLTHSDSDHVAGINSMHESYDFELICTSYCSSAIKSSKLNFSKYIPLFNGGFSIEMNVTEVNDDQTLEINGHLFHFIHTPGHTKGCMCIKVDDFLFTGDTIIKGTRTRINHRSGGSILDLSSSMDKLKKNCTENCMIYPGHGEPIRSFFKILT